MIRNARAIIPIVLLATAAGCATTNVTSAASAPDAVPPPRRDAERALTVVRDEPTSERSVDAAMPAEIARAVESRIADLRSRGGDCARYGAVLDHSYRSGRIVLRPFMWRVGGHLASGEARPDGRMMLAREIDSLNVGIRTVDDVITSMEHESAHIAFDFESGDGASEAMAGLTVRACKA